MPEGNGPFFPIAGPYTWGSQFGEVRDGGKPHNGQDLPAAQGTPVVATQAGKLHFSSSAAGGNEANLDVGPIRFYMCHLSAQIGGDRDVKAGEVIGKVGSTGNSTGPHLHFSMFQNGALMDPRPYLRAVEANKVADAQAAMTGGSSTPSADQGASLNPVDAALAPFKGIADFAGSLTEGATWVRILYVVGGAGLIIAGIVILKRDLILGAGKTAAAVALAPETGGASLVAA